MQHPRPDHVQEVKPLGYRTAAHKMPVHAIDLDGPYITRNVANAALALGHFIDYRRPGDDHPLNDRGFIGERHLSAAVGLAANERIVAS